MDTKKRAPLSERERRVAAAGLELLEAGKATVSEMAPVLAESLGEHEPYVVRALSTAYLCAADGWEHVWPLEYHGTTRVLSLDPSLGERQPEPFGPQRMSRAETARLVRVALRQRPGQWLDAEELCGLIGFGGSSSSLLDALHAQRRSRALRGVETMIRSAPGRTPRRVYRWPVEGAPGVADDDDTLDVLDEPGAGGAHQAPLPMTSPRVQEFRAAFAAVRGMRDDSTIPTAPDERARPEWETITEQRAQGAVGEHVESVLLRRADGTLWKATPFKL